MNVKKALSENRLPRHVYKSKRLGSFFNIKDQTKLEHIYDLKNLETKCPKNNPGETAGELMKRYQNMPIRIRSHICQGILYNLVILQYLEINLKYLGKVLIIIE